MKDVVKSLFNKERKLKQKTKKMKYREDGKLKKVVEREVDYVETPEPKQE